MTDKNTRYRHIRSGVYLDNKTLRLCRLVRDKAGRVLSREEADDILVPCTQSVINGGGALGTPFNKYPWGDTPEEILLDIADEVVPAPLQLELSL